jgi:pimeloyl-[acyl-carrier protein] methyl ester esterase
MSAQMVRERASGIAARLHVDASGTGPPVVLLHGFALHGGLLAPLASALAPHHRVHVVDLPGHGWSATVEPFDLPTFASTVDRALADVREPLTVLGWSLGGQVAMQWAVARPERVRRLILVASTPSFVAREGWPSGIAETSLARFGDELRTAYALTLRRFLALQVRGSDEGRRTLTELRGRLTERGEPSREGLRAALALVTGNDLRPLLAQVQAPTLVVAGDRDVLVPLASTRALAAALPNAVHRTIPGAAHAPFLSHPAAFRTALEGFIDE